MSRSVIAQSCAFSKSVKLFFSYMLLPRWNCKLYKWKMKKIIIKKKKNNNNAGK